MRRMKWLALVAVMALAALPVAAGGYGKKCTASTQDCLNHMAAQMKNSGWIGVELDEDQATGAYKVTKVVPGSPAEASGIQPGDVLYALNGIRISEENHEALMKAKKEWKPGQSVTYTIKRDGTDRQVSLTLAPMPADVLARYIGTHMLEHATVEVVQKSDEKK